MSLAGRVVHYRKHQLVQFSVDESSVQIRDSSNISSKQNYWEGKGQENLWNHNIQKKIRFFFIYLDSGLKLFYVQYREFSPYANFITAKFITAIFQNYY